MPYQLFFRGKDGQSLSVGGLSIVANRAQFVHSLPIPFVQMCGITKLDVQEVASIPDVLGVAAVTARLSGRPAIVWLGTVEKRFTEHGAFIRGEPRFDLSPKVVEVLSGFDGFKKIGA
jgi:hypothetical protein